MIFDLVDEGARSCAGAHLRAARDAMAHLDHDAGRAFATGRACGSLLVRGARLLAVGNGGSAAHAQHLGAELVGRYRRERVPLDAMALTADASITTALLNDYGVDEVFRRQVLAHGRAGDVLVAFSTSGRSPNVLAAARAASDLDLHVVAFTGPAPNPLAASAEVVFACGAPATPTVQEVHQVLLHLFCAGVDDAVDAATRAREAVHA